MSTISGNFNTKASEIKAVCDFLERIGLNPNKCAIEKFGEDKAGNDTNAKSIGDVYVKFEDKTYLLFEVKEEAINRIREYHQLGIDFISAFSFIPGSTFRIGLHSPSSYNDFISTIDINATNFKWGKLCYSNSDIWIFYCKLENGEYEFLNGYDYLSMKEDKFFEYLKEHCQFAINNKSDEQMSNSDTWMSATFFVDLKYLERYLISSKEQLYHDDSNFTKRATKNNGIKNICCRCKNTISENVCDYSMKHYKKPLCFSCQRLKKQ